MNVGRGTDLAGQAQGRRATAGHAVGVDPTGEECLKLTTYFGERDRSGRRLLADALLDLYERHAVATSILMRGAAGFGIKHRLRTDQLLTLSEDLPVVSVAVDRRPRIESLLPELLTIKRRGLLTLERARMFDITGGVPAAPREVERSTGASKLTLYVGRHRRVGGVPGFVAICSLLHARGLAGATVLLGVDGTAGGERRRASFFAANADVPVMITSVGPSGEIERVLAELGDLLGDSIATLERVRVCKRDGQLLASPRELPGTDAHGLALWQKLTIHTSDAARHGRHPVHRQLIRRLRAAEVSGTTILRGIWGFHGRHVPHGDRLLQRYRHVPVVTIVIDRPERIATIFPIVDELTAERGLVTSEMVPALTAILEGRRWGGVRLATDRGAAEGCRRNPIQS